MRTLLVLLLLAAASVGCRRKSRVLIPLPPPAASRTPRPPAAPPPAVGQTETGIASWYGHPYHGRKAANGETYDMEQMTAAHRTLPFQTWVRVENLTNGKTVEVRITDRGPFIGGRIIDLSHAAARSIDMIGPGTARVRLEVIRAPAVVVTEAAQFGVQAGAFGNRANADRMRAGMETRYGTAQLVLSPGSGATLWRVLVGSESTEEAAMVLAERIRLEIGERNAFVVRLDREWLTASSAGHR